MSRTAELHAIGMRRVVHIADGQRTREYVPAGDYDALAARAEKLQAALAVLVGASETPVCAACNGRGEIGGYAGQTPESFDYVSEPCPECTAQAIACEAASESIPLPNIMDLLPGTYYMDPPDGGDTPPLEQLRRMAADASRYRWLRADPVGRHTLNGGIPWCVHVVIELGMPTMRAAFGDVLDAAIDLRLTGESV